MDRLIVYLTMIVFAAYGLLFTLIPYHALEFLLQTKLDTTSAYIDIRATYGGMSLSLASILYMFSKDNRGIEKCLLMIFLLMVGMASTRLFGFLVDGSPNNTMLVYLALELITGAISLRLLLTKYK